jgi:FKBP-type peptidyl-prolyl cis-trans isomerase SlyD
MPKQLWVAAIFLGLFQINAAAPLDAGQAGKDDTVKDGSVVSLQYTLSGEDGAQIESNKGKEPLTYTQGQHQIIPGLEREMAGMKTGGEKHVKVKPEDGYGPVNPAAFQEVPKEKIPPEALKVGTVLQARGPQGQVVHARIKEIKDKTVVVDLNHPMAGKTLVFDVKVLDVQNGSAAALPSPATPPQSSQPAKPAQPSPIK